MGGLDTEITDATTTIALEMAWFEHGRRSAQTVTRIGLRSEASARFERGVDPYGMPTAIARFVELLARDVSRPRRARRRRRRPRRTAPAGAIARPTCASRRSTAILGTPARRRRSARAARPDRLHRDRRRATCEPWRCRRGGPTPPPRSTSSRRSPATTATTASARRFPKSVVHGGLHRPPAATPPGSRGAARPRDLRGDAEPVPRARHASSAPGFPPSRCPITNPLVADESVLRTSLRPGLLAGDRLQRVAPPHRRRSCSRSATCTRRATAELPGEYEALTVVLGRRRGARGDGGVARDLSSALGVGARIDQSKPPAGLHPTRSATLQAGRDPLGGVGEVAPRCARAVRRVRARRDPRARSRPTARP